MGRLCWSAIWLRRRCFDICQGIFVVCYLSNFLLRFADGTITITTIYVHLFPRNVCQPPLFFEWWEDIFSTGGAQLATCPRISVSPVEYSVKTRTSG